MCSEGFQTNDECIVHITAILVVDRDNQPVVDKVMPPKKKKKSCVGKLERAPNPRTVCTLIVNLKSPEEREVVIKCLRRHNENGWIAEERIEIGWDTFEERTIEVRIGLFFFFFS
jgi:hypothetical protein